MYHGKGQERNTIQSIVEEGNGFVWDKKKRDDGKSFEQVSAQLSLDMRATIAPCDACAAKHFSLLSSHLFALDRKSLSD